MSFAHDFGAIFNIFMASLRSELAWYYVMGFNGNVFMKKMEINGCKNLEWNQTDRKDAKFLSFNL